MRHCLYTGAILTTWAGILTQIPPDDIRKPHNDKSHEPLPFLSGNLEVSQLRWSTLEKEDFVIMATIERTHCLVSDPKGFDHFRYQNNLIFHFYSLSIQTDLMEPGIRKPLRWAMRLSEYK